VTPEEISEAAQLPTRPRPSIGRWIFVVVVVGGAADSLYSLVVNKAVQWRLVGHYLFNPSILQGVVVTIELTVLSMILALLVAVIVALARLSKSRAIRTIAFIYVWIFRSIPLLVLLVLWYNIALFYPRFGLGIPFGPTFVSVPSARLVTALGSAVAALALNEAAYASEILRASILAVPKGQSEAGIALGMPPKTLFRRIVLPQALKIAIPPLGNDTINMVKSTALVAFIAVPDLLYASQVIYESNYEIVPLLLVATAWYLAIVSCLSVLQIFTERHMDRSTRRSTNAQIPYRSRMRILE